MAIKLARAGFEVERLKIFSCKGERSQVQPIAQEILSDLNWLQQEIVGLAEVSAHSSDLWRNQALLNQIEEL